MIQATRDVVQPFLDLFGLVLEVLLASHSLWTGCCLEAGLHAGSSPDCQLRLKVLPSENDVLKLLTVLEQYTQYGTVLRSTIAHAVGSMKL